MGNPAPFPVFLSIPQGRKGGMSLTKGLLCWTLKSITVVALRPLPPASSSYMFSPGVFPNEILACFIPSRHLLLRPTLTQYLHSPRANCCSLHNLWLPLAILASAPAGAFWVQGWSVQREKRKQREVPKTHLAT